jgi:glycosyltransferase involved in cell wall biosynthesis
VSSSPIHVLHVTAVETANYFLNNLAAHLDRAQVETTAVTMGFDRGFVSALEAHGARAIALRCPRRWQYPKAAWRLAGIVKERRVDLLHLHLFEPTLVGLAVAGWLGKKALVTRHHSDAIHKLPGTVRRVAYEACEGWINRRATHIIAPSRAVREVLLTREMVSPERVSLIPYGQSRERFDAVSAAGVAQVRAELGMDRQTSLVCVSRLHPEKGHRYLLDAVTELLSQGLEVSLFLLGVGPLRGALEAEVARRRLTPRIRFLGWRDDALTILAAADVVVHPSLHEALPSAVIEAVALARPVVATDVSGVRDILGEGAFGRIVPTRDPAALARAIRETLADLPGARHRASSGSRALLEQMDPGRVAAAHLRCYRQCFVPRAGSRPPDP